MELFCLLKMLVLTLTDHLRLKLKFRIHYPKRKTWHEVILPSKQHYLLLW